MSVQSVGLDWIEIERGMDACTQHWIGLDRDSAYARSYIKADSPTCTTRAHSVNGQHRGTAEVRTLQTVCGAVMRSQQSIRWHGPGATLL
jgi:hypothetical protein